MFVPRNGLGIDVHCALDSRVPQKFLLHFDIRANAAQHGGVGMPKGVPADLSNVPTRTAAGFNCR